MTINDAITALLAAREVSGGDSLLALSVTGPNGFTTSQCQFVGPVSLEAEPGRTAYLLAALGDPLRQYRGPTAQEPEPPFFPADPLRRS